MAIGLMKMLLPVALIVGLGYLVTANAGLGWGVGVTILAVATTLALLKRFGMLPIPILFPFNVQITKIVAWGGLIAVLVMTGMATDIWNQLGLGGAVAQFGGEITPSGDCVVSDELRGKTSTGDVNAYDQESATPYSAAVDTTAYYYMDGVFQAVVTDTSGATANGSIGDVLTTYGGGTTYYGDMQTFCLDKARPPIELSVHTIVDDTDMVITGYQDDGTSALTTGTTDEEDYEIALGANEDYTFYLKLKTNVANKMFRLGGICTIANGDVDKCDLNEAGWSQGLVPSFMSNTNVAYNDSLALNLTGGYEKCWYPSTPVDMHQWDSVKYQFLISSDSSGTDAQDGASATATGDLCIVQFLDAQWARGDGQMHLDVHDHSVDQSNVGLSETLTSPYQKDTGVIIEAT